MPAPLSYKNDSDEDKRLNPTETAKDLHKQEQQSGYDRDFNALTDPDHLSKDGKSGDINQAELDADPGWRTDPSVYGGNMAGPDRRLTWKNIKAIGKRRGAGGVVISLVLFGAFGVGGLLSGGSLLINLKEQLANNLMDAVPTVFNAKGKTLFNYKFGSADLTSGSCGVMTIRCKFKTMSERQITNLEKSGRIKVMRDGLNFTGRRAKVSGIQFKGNIIAADQIIQATTDDPDLARELRRGGFNPKTYTWKSSSALKFFQRSGMSKRSALPTTADKEAMRQAVNDNVEGSRIAFEKAGLRPAPPDGDNPQYYDENNNIISQDAANAKAAAADANFAEAVEAKKALREAGGNLSKVVGSAVKGTVLVGTGLVDSACTGWMLLRVAAFAAKYFAALQLMRYTNIFLNEGDKQKAGDAAQETTDFLASIITTANSAGVSGTDSRGWKYMAYGDVTPIPELGKGAVTVASGALESDSADQEVLKAEVTNFVAGQITAKGVMADLARLVDSSGNTEVADATCGFVKSAGGQALIIGVGVLALGACVVTTIIGVGAACLTGNVIAQASLSVAIGVSVAFLSPWLISLAQDNIVSSITNGNEAVNAIVSGGGAMNSNIGLASGLGYLSTGDSSIFDEERDSARSEFAAADRAESGQFDASNPNSFVGKLASFIQPLFPQTNSSPFNLLSFVSSFTRGSLSTMASSVSAKSYGDAGVCPDLDYEGVATDINCNPLVGQSTKTLNKDIDEVMDFMEAGHIDPVSGAATSDEYGKFLEKCVERTSAFGSFEEGELADDVQKGKICVEGYNDMYDTFRSYLSLLLVNEMMDGGSEVDGEGQATSDYSFYEPSDYAYGGSY